MSKASGPLRYFNAREFVTRSVAEIKKEVGNGKAVSACSGGVDSTVASLLAHKAIGDRLTVIYVDDGMRREGEPEAVVDMLRDIGMQVKILDAKGEFFRNLKGKFDAEEKRLAFRQTFYTVLGSEVRKFSADYLIQGTIAADVVETAGGVKTQHNVLEQIGVDPRQFGFKLVEPLKDLYKPQVRAVARELGLPKEVSEKMPFPGPGLCIRVLGEVTPERVEVLRKATKIVEEETSILSAFQRFAVLHSDKATGVREGKRAYGHIITIRLVESEDAMTARALEVPYHLLKVISKRILDEVPEVSRCLYDITDKPPATIEFE
ncbi:MAG: glutamine-hydrolyzing GMP synthase [Candidatus Bathyarchaeia archaeon]